MDEKLISAAVLIEHFTNMKNLGFDVMPFSFIKNSIESAPSVEAKPVVCAHWIDKGWEGGMVCSKCGGSAIEGRYEYQILSTCCPHCGAPMIPIEVEEAAK